MKIGKIAPVMVLVMGMGTAAWWASTTLASVDERDDEGVEAPFVPEPAPVRVEASKRGGALNALSSGTIDEGDAGGRADGDVSNVEQEVGRGGALARLERQRRVQRAEDASQAEEDWSEGPRAEVGPARWMPKRLSEEEAGELQSELDEGEMRQAQLLAMREDRQRSIDVVAPGVQACFEELRAREPQRQGRLALTWTMLAGGGLGLISEVQVRANVGLREPGFESCVMEAVQGLSFEATGESELLVEWAYTP
ncbi:hypothetical protein EA187_08295 [Lujinxingia sediminis]|uniref:AgmX/PglI C-terminal domain-containing protein n=1 Tax=Lujinxingia sediminis TaxID=2480984 RepID=A0ABY0CTV3_9DELT|nr:hypothetical protein [Lujinxingia sediminis]RVU45754.1 hypothetical protein EA187_08295 [Lujinxingia sediminis]